jgi:hypothetical protein
VLVAMLAARARAMAGRPPEDALKLVAYGTNQVLKRINTSRVSTRGLCALCQKSRHVCAGRCLGLQTG